VLELTRLHRLRVRQDEAFADIVCSAVEAEIPLESLPVADTVTA
jgi:segregation and condensation protein A